MRRKLVILSAVIGFALISVLALFVITLPESALRAYSRDQRVKIYDVQDFPGTNVDYAFVPLIQQPKYQCQRLLYKLGFRYRSWRPLPPLVLKTAGPAFVLYARIAGNESPVLELVTEDGDRRMSPMLFPGYRPGLRFTPDPCSKLMVWPCRLTESVYHLRLKGETNDLAIVRLNNQP